MIRWRNPLETKSRIQEDGMPFRDFTAPQLCCVNSSDEPWSGVSTKLLPNPATTQDGPYSKVSRKWSKPLHNQGDAPTAKCPKSRNAEFLNRKVPKRQKCRISNRKMPKRQKCIIFKPQNAQRQKCRMQNRHWHFYFIFRSHLAGQAPLGDVM